MNQQHRNNPLHGVKLNALLDQLVDHYGWEILAAQMKINCFKNYPSVKSSEKFLRKTQWAREKTEAFYLYCFKQLPKPSDEEHLLPPRERSFEANLEPQLPAIITETDKEFFDDPASGPVFKKAHNAKSRPHANKEPGTEAKSRRQKTIEHKNTNHSPSVSPDDKGQTTDPWAKWKAKNETD